MFRLPVLLLKELVLVLATLVLTTRLQLSSVTEKISQQKGTKKYTTNMTLVKNVKRDKAVSSMPKEKQQQSLIVQNYCMRCKENELRKAGKQPTTLLTKININHINDSRLIRSIH